ncbi:MAG TPA: DUF4361 domain-containing protein [Chitinophagaceae bacterium]
MKWIRLPIFFLMTGMLFSACLKEKYQIENDGNTDRVIAEFTNAKDGVGSVALEFATQMIEVDLTELRIPPRSEINGSVQVKIAENNALVTTGGYSTLPPGSYSIVQNEYTLTANERKATVRLKVNPSALVGGSFAIGLSIQQVSQGEINQAAKDILIEVKVKNDYEGEYYAQGLLIAYTGADNTFPLQAQYEIDEDKTLTTIDQTTVEMIVGYPPFTGAYMFLEIDPVTNLVTVTPSAAPPTFPTIANDGVCKYDPATKSFTLNYKYFNAAGRLRSISETLTLK